MRYCSERRKYSLFTGKNNSNASNLYIGLIHYPVLNKNGECVASAVTNLDIHDLARIAMTYGLGGYYVITPLEDQIKLAETLISHWTQGPAGLLNLDRKKALSMVKVVASLDAMLEDIEHCHNMAPGIIVTSARNVSGCINFNMAKRIITGKFPVAMLLGTASGLAPQILNLKGALQLAPVKGAGGYNHLSVRAAGAIILDRLLGRS